MTKAYMIAECVGHSIYEEHTIAFVYLKREWAEYQVSILKRDAEGGTWFRIREVTIVSEGPK